jgi:hypothetical protein
MVEKERWIFNFHKLSSLFLFGGSFLSFWFHSKSESRFTEPNQIRIQSDPEEKLSDFTLNPDPDLQTQLNPDSIRSCRNRNIKILLWCDSSSRGISLHHVALPAVEGAGAAGPRHTQESTSLPPAAAAATAVTTKIHSDGFWFLVSSSHSIKFISLFYLEQKISMRRKLIVYIILV